MSQMKEWILLRRDIIARIDAIDKATPWSENPPPWWTEMMAVWRAALNSKCSEPIADPPKTCDTPHKET